MIHDSNNNNSNNNVDGFNNLGASSLSHIFRCGSKCCQFQNKFVPVNNILSTTTNRLYRCIIPSGSTYVNDHSSNVVYVITCNKCKLQYVREIFQNFKRFNGHNSCFRNPTAYSFCKILNTHLKFMVIAKTLLILSILLKNLRGPDVQIGILWILQLNHFKRLEGLIGCMNYEQFFHRVLMTG